MPGFMVSKYTIALEGILNTSKHRINTWIVTGSSINIVAMSEDMIIFNV